MRPGRSVFGPTCGLITTQSHRENITEEEHSWVSELPCACEQLQAEGSAAPLEQRREMLPEGNWRLAWRMCRRPNDSVPRSGFGAIPLPARSRRTPTVRPSRGSPTSALPSGTPATRPRLARRKSAEELLSDFLTAAADLPEEQRDALARKLGEAGFTWVDRDALVLEVGEEFRKGLGLPGANTAPDPGDAAQPAPDRPGPPVGAHRFQDLGRALSTQSAPEPATRFSEAVVQFLTAARSRLNPRSVASPAC